MTDFGEIVRYYRLFLGFRQEEMTGISDSMTTRSSYTYRELGVTRFSLDELLALAAVFGIPPRAFCHPELCGSDKTGKRTRRHSKASEPRYICDLSSEEREIIARRRMKHAAR